MIWLSAESALMSISPSASGPTAMPATRKMATSGILIFCAAKAASVPIARISPQDSSVCWATSIEAEGSTTVPEKVLNQFQPQRSADDFGGALQRRQRDIAIFRVEQTADRAARLHFLRQSFPGNVIGFHGFENLPGKNFLDGCRLKLFELALIFQKVIERAQAGRGA